MTIKTESLAGRENAKWGWREIQQDLKKVWHPVVILNTLKKYMEFYIIELLGGRFLLLIQCLVCFSVSVWAQSLFTEIKYTHSFLWMMGTPGQLFSTAIGQSISSNGCGAMPDYMRWRSGLEFPANWMTTLKSISVCSFYCCAFFLCLATCLDNLGGHLGDTAFATA